MAKKGFLERAAEEIWPQATNKLAQSSKPARAVKREGLLELSEICRRVLYYFFDCPDDAIGLNGLAENVKASKTSTREAVLLLEKHGYIKKDVIGNAWRIYAHNPNEFFFTISKIPYNLQLIYESAILGTIYDKLPGAKAIILFGSYRHGTNNKNSDVDIAVETAGGKDLQIVTLGTVNFGFRKNVKVNLHIFSRNNIDLNLFTNIANGIVLDGLLEVRP